MTKVEIHPEARREFLESLAYFHAADPKLSFDFDACFRRVERLISQNPELYSLRKYQVRRANLTSRFGEYYIAYMLWHEKIIILAIGHAKRRPFYFRRRIGEARKMF